MPIFSRSARSEPSSRTRFERQASVFLDQGKRKMLVHKALSVYLGNILIAPSKRITEPLSIEFSAICWTNDAYSWGEPRR